jgi:hypothetical protein
MYTQTFIDAQNRTNELEIAFNLNPSKQTATPLAQSRVELEKLSVPSVKYTKEFRAAEKNRTINSITECMINIINK